MGVCKAKTIAKIKASALNKVNYVPVEIDVNNLDKDKTFKTSIRKPSGIRSVSETNITIKIKIIYTTN